MGDEADTMPAWAVTLRNGAKVSLVRDAAKERNMLIFRREEHETTVRRDEAIARAVRAEAERDAARAEAARWKHDHGLLKVALAKAGDKKRAWRQRAMTAEREAAVAAREAAAWCAGRDAAAADADCGCDARAAVLCAKNKGERYRACAHEPCCAWEAMSIRELEPPADLSSALAARVAAAERRGIERAAEIAAERAGWAANELDDGDPVGTLRAEGKMDAAQEIASAIRELLREGER